MEGLLDALEDEKLIYQISIEKQETVLKTLLDFSATVPFQWVWKVIQSETRFQAGKKERLCLLLAMRILEVKNAKALELLVEIYQTVPGLDTLFYRRFFSELAKSGNDRFFPFVKAEIQSNGAIHSPWMEIADVDKIQSVDFCVGYVFWHVLLYVGNLRLNETDASILKEYDDYIWQISQHGLGYFSRSHAMTEFLDDTRTALIFLHTFYKIGRDEYAIIANTVSHVLCRDGS